MSVVEAQTTGVCAQIATARPGTATATSPGSTVLAERVGRPPVASPSLELEKIYANPPSDADARLRAARAIADPPNGHIIVLGDGSRVHVAMPDPRCVMPTLSQNDLPRDNDILRTLVRHNRLEIEAGARFPCAGVYGVVEEAGTLRVGDRVAVI